MVYNNYQYNQPITTTWTTPLTKNQLPNTEVTEDVGS